MKPGQEDRLGAQGVLSPPRECTRERLPPPEIVGQVDEAVRRLWWRAFDRVCAFFLFTRLSIFYRIFGPEPTTPDDMKREVDQERLVRAFQWSMKQSNRRNTIPAKIETAK
jgi:hypothetical protein